MPTQIYRTKDKKRVSGVTTILSGNLGWSARALMHWAWQCGIDGLDYNAERDEAASAGTWGHLLAEHDVKGLDRPEPLPGLSEEAKAKGDSAFEAYLSWKRMSKLQIRAAEVALVSEELRYGGCLDGVGLVEDAPCLIDFKTSNGTYGNHVIQLAAYMALWEENNPDLPLIGGAHLLRFGKEEGNFVHSYIPRAALLDKPWTAFKACLVLHNLKKHVEGLA